MGPFVSHHWGASLENRSISVNETPAPATAFTSLASFTHVPSSGKCRRRIALDPVKSKTGKYGADIRVSLGNAFRMLGGCLGNQKI
jgi:hypothetical protein